MKEEEKILFEKLKKQVAQTFLRENPAQSQDISQWKGDDIVRFQEDLLHKVKGRVSEKWFYNYFRNDIQKLPRIDMLNLLSEYAGYKNWADFSFQNSRVKSKKMKFVYLWIVLAGLIFLGFVLWKPVSPDAVFSFVDESGQSITNIEVVQLFDNQSEKKLNVENGKVKPEVVNNEVRLKIVSPYYKDKIIFRHITRNNYRENIELQPDIFALLLKRYSDVTTDNWQKRRQFLQKLIADDALIYQQWFGNGKGIELYDKDDFIAQLCIPTGMLRNIDILEVVYKHNTITKLRFTIKESTLDRKK